MGQVPRYLIIGAGRLARHFQHYFSLLDLPFTSWCRQEPRAKLYAALPHASHVLVLVSDQAIENFVRAHKEKTKAYWIHCSGSLVSEICHGAHPLMTFGETYYDLTVYPTIPFILDHDAPTFSTLLPGLPNTHARLDTRLKAKYHALCVLSGNFSCMLWQKMFVSFEEELNLSPTLAHPYLKQQMQNIMQDAASALTGPLVRRDTKTIEKNIAALTADAFQDIYKSFVSCYQQLKEKSSYE